MSVVRYKRVAVDQLCSCCGLHARRVEQSPTFAADDPELVEWIQDAERIVPRIAAQRGMRLRWYVEDVADVTYQ